MNRISGFELPFFQRLSDSPRILVAGAGGGFDVFSGLPLYFLLRESGREVYLANLSFASLDPSVGRWLTPTCVEVTADLEAYLNYFPEKMLCQWFRKEGEEVSIYASPRTGVRPLRETYQKLVEELNLDTIILVDGGTDSLMCGDEVGLGTPAEDMASIAAVHQVDIPSKFVVCLGFGVDWYHGICHNQVLEAVANLTREGGFLGSVSLVKSMPAVERFMNACTAVRQSMSEDHASIVCSSIVSALDGRFGAFHSTRLTGGDSLWINPLMTFYWCFDLGKVAERVYYLKNIVNTATYDEVTRAIESFRKTLGGHRSWQQIPI